MFGDKSLKGVIKLKCRVSQVALVVKNPPANAGHIKDEGSSPESERPPGGGQWQPTPLFLAGESHGQRSLADYSPWGCKGSDTTELLSMHIQIKRWSFKWTLIKYDWCLIRGNLETDMHRRKTM